MGTINMAPTVVFMMTNEQKQLHHYNMQHVTCNNVKAVCVSNKTLFWSNSYFIAVRLIQYFHRVYIAL
jgi:hypothetical protein